MNGATHCCLVCTSEQHRCFRYRGHDYYRCPSCGLVTTLPLPGDAEIEAHYAGRFDEGNYRLLQDYAAQYMDVYRGLAGDLSAYLAARGRDLTGLRVLDVGCFTGDFLTVLRDAGADVHGLELQSRAVEEANGKLDGRVLEADVPGRNFPQGPFDVVTLLGLIEHVVDPVKLVRRVHSLLTGGGALLIQTPNSGSLPARVTGKYWPPYEPVEHIHLFAKKSLEVLLNDMGFCDVRFRPHVKKLPVSYVVHMLKNFGPEWYRLARPLLGMLPASVLARRLRFYAGEIVLLASKKV